MLKILLALALGLGFLALDTHAKPTVAFLGLGGDSDPRFTGFIADRIRFELGADTSLFIFPREDVDLLFAKGILREPEAGPLDLAGLSKGLGAQYYAFGRLEPMAVESKRKWWTPWTVKVKWTRALRLRVLEGSTGKTLFDGPVTGELPEKAWFFAPDGKDAGRMPPLQRDTRMRALAASVSVETAKTLSKVLGGTAAREKEKAAEAAGGEKEKEKAADPAGSPEAKPPGG